MAITKKQIAFDLITDKNSPIYKYYNSLSSAYYYLEKYLNENDFPCHRQGSVFISVNALTYNEVNAIVMRVCEDIPWLAECCSAIDVTSIGRTHSLLGAVQQYCADNEDKRYAMELLHSDTISDELIDR